MNAILRLARAPLAVPAVFDLYQWLVGAPRCHRRFVADWVRPQPGDRLLDIGCGTGAVMPFLPAGVEVTGIDISEPYIRTARQRHGNRARFLVADAADRSLDLGGDYDTAYSFGVLHHIPDEPARAVVEGALARLRRGGRFVAIDPTLVDGQRWLSRTLVKGDRGEHVRTPAAMARLLDGLDARFNVATDMLNVPYAQLITVIVKR